MSVYKKSNRRAYFYKIGALLLGVSFTCLSQAQNYPPEIPTASKVETYKIVGEVDLKVWIFNPPKHQEGADRPGIVFFFGGGWRKGTPQQFVKHCEYLAARGMVAMVADYRVSSRHGVKAKSCVADAKSTIRWIRKNANKLGIDPERIVAGGGSAGGHLAASTATLPDHDDPQDDLTISAVPNALALFNPAVVMTHIKGEMDFMSNILDRIKQRTGTTPESISPYHHIKSGIGPTIIFHGTADTTVPFKSVELFDREMRAKGNSCTLVAYEGEKHGFFNYLLKNNGPFVDTINKLDAFLVDIGYLTAPVTGQEYGVEK